MAKAAGDRIRVDVAGRAIELSNLDKVLFPAAGFTKAEVIDYYTRIAPALLPHLAGRPVTRIRYPDGVAGPSFFEKNAPDHTPDWVHLERLPSPGSRAGRGTIDYILVDDLATLVWLANLAALELHVPQWRVGSTGPDRLVIDLDPGPPAGLVECMSVALRLRDRLAADGLAAYPKTSGRKGMQLMCAISGEQSADEVTEYAKGLAEELARETPGKVVSRMTKQLRPGKVFLDWSQNSASKTTVAPYSLRAEPRPSVSAPLTWDEVAAGRPLTFTAPDVLARVDEHGDLFAGLAEPGPRLPGG